MKKLPLLILMPNLMAIPWVNAEATPEETSDIFSYNTQLSHELASCQGKLVFNTKTGKTDCVDKNSSEPAPSCEMSFAGCNGSYHIEEK
ncbi:hypothetical protein DS893_01090 [Vibrionales bacterium C3R12]|nr:hypothetical protein DS893_01090 [Vibrionales bacterium C3R12]